MKKIVFIFLLGVSNICYSQNSNDLIIRIGAKKQADFDNIMSTLYNLRNKEIKHLDAEDENYNVNEIKKYYNNLIDSLEKSILKDAINAGYYQSEINKLISKYKNDENIKKIESSYYARERFFEDFKALRDKDPDKFIQMLKVADKEWGGNSIRKIWSPY